MELQLKIIGVLLIVLALIHGIFHSYFNWKTELKSLSLINKQMMVIHTFFVAFIVALMGVLCFTCAEELITTPLGKKISLGLAIFWFARLFVQFFGYSSELWKGKLFETIIHIVFSAFWLYLTAVFFLVYYESV